MRIFQAVRTRDAIARERDGQQVLEARPLGTDPRDGQLYEVRLADGEWIIATEHDIKEK